MNGRRAALLAGGVLAAMLILPAVAMAKYRGTDLLSGLGPSDGGWGGGPLMHQYPLSAYVLDSHVDTNLSPASWAQQFSQWIAITLWQITVWLVVLVLQLFAWCFSVDLFHAVLAPITTATQRLYNAIGQWWLGVAVLIAGIWGMWTGLVQRRYSHAMTGLARSVVFAVIALVLIFSAPSTVGAAADIVNEVSGSFLTALHPGSGNPRDAVSDSVFRQQVQMPWTVLEFGGLSHCVDPAVTDGDGFPKPVTQPLPAGAVCRNHLHANAAGYGGYAPRFLAADDNTRDRLYQAIKDGDASAAAGFPCVINSSSGGRCPPNPLAGFKVDKADAPAVDVQQAGGASQRLMLSLVIFLASLGVILVLGYLAVAIILSGVVALGLLSLSAFALLAGLIPGAGHSAYRRWFTAGAVSLFLKAAYSLILVVLLTVADAITPERSTLGWLGVFLLRGLAFWLLFAYRKRIARSLSAHTHHHRVADRAVQTIRHPVREVKAAARKLPDVQAPTPARVRDRQERVAHGRTLPSLEPTATKVPADSSSPPASAGREHSPAPKPAASEPPAPVVENPAKQKSVPEEGPRATVPASKRPPSRTLP